MSSFDPMLSLAYSMHKGPGIYAALLGSGVSRSAGIPTGWDVTLDLVKRVAQMHREDCGSDPERWYMDKHGEAPDYSKLLANLGRSRAERMGILRGYFEPTEEERSEGKKLPTSAHHAIASLVHGGHIRVILTTNFDRLMEQALDAKGVGYAVVSTADQAKGMLPLVHSACTVIKLHGDYKDTRIKNTQSELSKYSRPMSKLLKQALDEYGLIICGWSGEWDPALRSHIMGAPNRRFSTYWTMRGSLRGAAVDVARSRDAVQVQIKGADEFFVELAEKVGALSEVGRPEPMSVRLAVAAVKKYVLDDKNEIRMTDMVHAATEQAVRGLTPQEFPFNAPHPTWPFLWKQLEKYQARVNLLASMCGTLAYWDRGDYRELWTRTLRRVAQARPSDGGSVAAIQLRLFPALLLWYAIGVALTAKGRFRDLKLLIEQVEIEDRGNTCGILDVLAPSRVIEPNILAVQERFQQKMVPWSLFLEEALTDILREVIPDRPSLEVHFDRFEVLVSMKAIDEGHWWPAGNYTWRHARNPSRSQVLVVASEIEKNGSTWGPVHYKLFGDPEAAKTAAAKLLSHLKENNVRFRHWA